MKKGANYNGGHALERGATELAGEGRRKPARGGAQIAVHKYIEQRKQIQPLSIVVMFAFNRVFQMHAQ